MDRDFDTSFDKPVPIIVSVKGDAQIAARLQRVELDLSRFHNGRWALQLDAVMANRAEPAVILAQGVACLAVAWWAQLSPRRNSTSRCSRKLRPAMRAMFPCRALSSSPARLESTRYAHRE